MWKSGCTVTAEEPSLQRLKEGLSPLWAQELIGADLAKEFLAKHEKNSGRTYKSVTVANIDSGYDGVSSADVQNSVPKEKYSHAHATQVMNLIGGKGSYGVGRDVKIFGFSYNVDASDEKAPFVKAVDEAIATRADFVNLEVHTLCTLNATANCSWPDRGLTSANLREALPKLAEGRIVVAAAGNHYQEKNSFRTDPKLKDVILVGSTNEEGLVSYFSDESPDVTIVAPSDHHLFSPDGIKDNSFGGTSGAAPLVTGALANVARLLPGISLWEIRDMLEATATPIPALSYSQKNGVGMLNAYKMVRLAERLEAGWPENRHQIEEMAEAFDFSKEAAEHFKAAQKILARESKDCGDFRRAKDELRKSFLLNPLREVSDLLALMMAGSDSPRNSRFYAVRSPEDLDALLLSGALEKIEESREKYSVLSQSPNVVGQQARDRIAALLRSRTPVIGDLERAKIKDARRLPDTLSTISQVTEFSIARKGMGGMGYHQFGQSSPFGNLGGMYPPGGFNAAQPPVSP